MYNNRNAPCTKSLYRSCAGSHFYGTEYEIWADFWPVSNTEKKNWPNYEQFLRPVFIMFSWAKNVEKSSNTL